MNNHVIWNQQLLVPAGTHNVAVTKDGQDIWSGKLDVGANNRVIVYTNYLGKAKIKVKDWPDGAKMSSAPCFTAGTATIAIAPVTANFAVTPEQIDCSAPAKPAWTTTETLHSAITSDAGNFNELPLSGEQTVSPRKTSAYQFTTLGPGGVIETSDTLNVNPTVNATLNATPEVRYIRVGDTVLHQELATVTWIAANVDNVVLDPIGTVQAEGTEKLPLAPKKKAFGPVEEMRLFKISASNVCGGSQTREASVHLVGLLEPMIARLFYQLHILTALTVTRDFYAASRSNWNVRSEYLKLTCKSSQTRSRR